jgi:hypothetical protein
MNKILKIAMLALFFTSSGFITAEINPEETTTQEQKRRIVKEKLKNSVLAGIIGLGTGTIEGVADTVFLKRFDGNELWLLQILGLLSTWLVGSTIRHELIKDLEDNSPLTRCAAVMGSCIGRGATILLLHS